MQSITETFYKIIYSHIDRPFALSVPVPGPVPVLVPFAALPSALADVPDAAPDEAVVAAAPELAAVAASFWSPELIGKTGFVPCNPLIVAN